MNSHEEFFHDDFSIRLIISGDAREIGLPPLPQMHWQYFSEKEYGVADAMRRRNRVSPGEHTRQQLLARLSRH